MPYPPPPPVGSAPPACPTGAPYQTGEFCAPPPAGALSEVRSGSASGAGPSGPTGSSQLCSALSRGEGTVDVFLLGHLHTALCSAHPSDADTPNVHPHPPEHPFSELWFRFSLLRLDLNLLTSRVHTSAVLQTTFPCALAVGRPSTTPGRVRTEPASASDLLAL